MWQDDTSKPDCQEKFWEAVRARMRANLKELLEAVMLQEREEFLACAPFERVSSRRGYRNGFQERGLDTTLGWLRLRKPRVRGTAEPFRTRVVERYQRRQPQLDRTLLQWVAEGLSTRQASRSLQDVFGGVISPGGVSRVVASIEGRILSFHRRSLVHGYRHVYFDAKWGYISRKRNRRGRGKKKRAVLLIGWGVRHDGREELIDFRVADSESERNWTRFLTDLEARGLRRENPWGQRLQMIVTDGDAGLRAALWMVYPRVPKQRCIFHKVQDITAHLRQRRNRRAILASAGAIYDDLQTPYQARYRLQRWRQRWKEQEPEAVENFAYEFEDTLLYLNAPPRWRRRLRTTNPIERFIRELNRKYAKVGVFPSARSWERATFLVWEALKSSGYAPTRRKTPLTLFTHNT